MTSKTVVLYYSATGNTKAIVNMFQDKCDVYRINNFNTSLLDNYETIIIATSTWGKGIPPKAIIKVTDELVYLKGKKVGLLGSGNAHFEYFCGALDLLEEILKRKNEIIFKFKFEGYPKEQVFNEFKILLEELFNE